MSIFKTECDPKCAVSEATQDLVVRADMDFPGQDHHLPGFNTHRYADVQHVNPGAVRRNKAKG